MRPVNPYIVGNPVKDKTGFFGRQDVFRDVMQVLRQRESNAIVLYGQRRIGKTSVLLQLEKQLAQGQEFTPVYFDLQDKAAKSLPEVLFELSQHISRVTGHTIANQTDFGRTGDYFRSTFLPQIAEKVASGGLVLLFDEFDVLDSPMRTQAAEAFFPYLQQWMADLQKVKFVFVIGRRPEDLSIRTMRAFKNIQSTRVSFLGKKDAGDVVRQSERDGSLKWDDAAVQRVLALSHAHPYFTQLLCSVIWENAHEEGPSAAPVVLAKDVDNAVPQALKFGANALNWLWDGLPPAERVVVAAMAEIKDEVITQDKLIETLNQSGVRLVARELEFAPETLIDWEVLIQSDGGYRFAVPLLRRWVVVNRPLRRVKDELDRLDPLADTLFQAGQGFYNNNNLDSAEQPLRQALNINPNHLKARLLLGRILLEKGKLADSVDMFDAAFQYDERATRADFIKSLLALAESQSQDENLQLATYERVLRVQGDQPLANERVRAIWIKRGEAAQAQENFDEAIKAFEQVGQTERVEKVRAMLREKKLAAQMQQAQAYEKSGQWKSALDAYLALASEYSDSETLQTNLATVRTNWRAESLQQLESFDAEENREKFSEFCDGLEKDFPDDPEVKTRIENARGQLGVTQKYHEAVGILQSGQVEQARQMFSQVLAANPKHLRAAHKLIETTYGKVNITRPVPAGVWIPVGITSLLWIFIGILAASGLFWNLFADRVFNVVRGQLPTGWLGIEMIILAIVVITALIGTAVTMWAQRVLDIAFRVEMKERPFFWQAFWVHFPFGVGLFYVDRSAWRRWVYPFLALALPIALLVSPFLLASSFDDTKENNPDFFKSYSQGSYQGEIDRASSYYGEEPWNIALGVVGGAYLLSLVDVMVTCAWRRSSRRLKANNIVKEPTRRLVLPSVALPDWVANGLFSTAIWGPLFGWTLWSWNSELGYINDFVAWGLLIGMILMWLVLWFLDTVIGNLKVESDNPLLLFFMSLPLAVAQSVTLANVLSEAFPFENFLVWGCLTLVVWFLVITYIRFLRDRKSLGTYIGVIVAGGSLIPLVIKLFGGEINESLVLFVIASLVLTLVFMVALRPKWYWVVLISLVSTVPLILVYGQGQEFAVIFDLIAFLAGIGAVILLGLIIWGLAKLAQITQSAVNRKTS